MLYDKNKKTEMNYLFDTNFYRKLATLTPIKQEKILQQIDEKKTIGDEFLFSSIVSTELLKHFLPEDPALNNCFKALKLKIRICSNSRNSAPEFTELFSYYFLGKKSPLTIYNQNLQIISNNIAKLKDTSDLISFKNEIEQVIKVQKNELANIINNLENDFLKGIKESAEPFEIFKKDKKLRREFTGLIRDGFFHYLFTCALYKKVKPDLLLEEINMNIIHKALNDFIVSTDFFITQVLKKLIDIQKTDYIKYPETDKKKRWNSFYDTQLIMAVEFENLRGRPTKLVTGDIDVINTFKIHKKDNYFISADEFIN